MSTASWLGLHDQSRGISPASQPSLIAAAWLRALSRPMDTARTRPLCSRPPGHKQVRDTYVPEAGRRGGVPGGVQCRRAQPPPPPPAGRVFPTVEDGGAQACQTPDRPSDFGGWRRQGPDPWKPHLHPPHPAVRRLGGRPLGPPQGSGVLSRFVHAAARSAARRPKTTVALWLALIVACVALGSSAGMRTLSNAARAPVNPPVPTRGSPRRDFRARQGERARSFEQSGADRTRGERARGRRGRLSAVKSVQGPSDSSGMSLPAAEPGSSS